MNNFTILSSLLNNTDVTQCKDLLLIENLITGIEKFHYKPFINEKSNVFKNWYVPNGKKKDGRKLVSQKTKHAASRFN